MDNMTAFAARGDAISGSVSVGDGQTFDVGAALEDGDGVIVVVADSPLERALVGYPGVARTDVPKGSEPVNAEEAEGTSPNASKAAIKKAAELGVDLSEVTGTGSRGAIKVTDVEAAAEAAEAEEEGGDA